MKRGFALMFQVATNLSSHVLYTVLVAGGFYLPPLPRSTKNKSEGLGILNFKYL
jgi:hypothetical protein